MKKSLISIAAVGLLSIPALASSTTVQTGSVVGPVLRAELDRLGAILVQRKLTEDDFVDVRPMVTAWVANQDLRDPAGAADHAVIIEQIDGLKAMGVETGPYILIIDDFWDFRNNLVSMGLITRVKEYRGKVLGGQTASVQPIRDAITERRTNAVPSDPRSAADAVATTQIAEELAMRAAGTPTKARKGDFNFLIEVVQGQRFRKFTGITLLRREGGGRVSPVDFKHARNLVSARHTAEVQLYRDAGVELTRMNKSISDVQAYAMQASKNPAPFRYLSAMSADLDLRRSMSFLQRKAVGGNQTVTQFDRLRDMMTVRSQGTIGRSSVGRDLSKAINTEIVRLEQISKKRKMVADDFDLLERLRGRLLSNAAEATFKK